MDLNRVSKFQSIVKDYSDKKTSADTKITAEAYNHKIRLGIGAKTGEAFGVSRTVKQLAHTLSQLHKGKDDKTSYEGKILKDFLNKHVKDKDLTQRLAQEGVFNGKMTFGKLQRVSEALGETTIDLKQKAPQTQKTSNTENRASGVNKAFSKMSPKKLAQSTWMKKKTQGASKRDDASAAQSSTSFFSQQRDPQPYDKLSPEDKATLAAIIDQKQQDFAKDASAIQDKETEFLNTQKSLESLQAEYQKKLETQAESFPDLMAVYNAAKEDKTIQYKTPEASRKACIDKLVDIKFLILDLKAERNELESQDQKRLNTWIANVQKLLNAWEETNYVTLNPQKLNFVDDFCESSKKSFGEYKRLIKDSRELEEKRFAEFVAVEEEPMDRLLKDESLPATLKGFLLQELDRFTKDNSELQGFDKYKAFINHVMFLNVQSGIRQSSLPDDINFSPIEGMSALRDDINNQNATFDAFIAGTQKKKSIANSSRGPKTAEKSSQKIQAKAEWTKPLLPYQKALFNLLDNPNNRHDLELSLKAYAKQKNQLSHLLQAKLVKASTDTYEGDPKFENVRQFIENTIFPKLLNQSLSLQDMETIDRRILLYVASKKEQLFTELKLDAQDEDLKDVFVKKLKQLNRGLEGSDELAQKMMQDWYAYREQTGLKNIITEAQIDGFLNHLEQQYKTQ